MNRFFFNFIKVLFSFLGIGFVSKVREVLATVVALLLVLLVPDQNKLIILTILILLSITFFALFSSIVAVELSDGQMVLKRAIGAWISSISPFVLINMQWMLVNFFVYLTVNAGLKDIQYMRVDKLQLGSLNLLKRDMLCGILSLVVLQILYAASMVLPFIGLFLKNEFN